MFLISKQKLGWDVCNGLIHRFKEKQWVQLNTRTSATVSGVAASNGAQLILWAPKDLTAGFLKKNSEPID